ncbi:MAG: hypothetical protein IKT81_04155 [Clostridia bacterium]|nr:hypothetical protein [Clostridia bacterium]
MSKRFSFDDKSLQRYVTDACAELKNTDVCAAPHTFSDRMRSRMSETLRKERRYRIWQKAKMVLAVILTLLVAAAFVYCCFNPDIVADTLYSIQHATEPSRATSKHPSILLPTIWFTEEVRREYRIFRIEYDTIHVVSFDRVSSYIYKAEVSCLKDGKSQWLMDIKYYRTLDDLPKNPVSEGVTVWGYPASVVGEKYFFVSWVDTHNEIYYEVQSDLPLDEIIRIANNITTEY